jgi:4-amino-4-deoxy-L-arabinose transferase-like glycosyltransferase
MNTSAMVDRGLSAFFRRHGILVLLGVLTLLRVVLSAKLQLHPDEAYYWLWSTRLDWSYFDHPPMVAYFIRATTLLSQAEFFVRLSALLTFVAGLWMLWRLARELFGDDRAAWYALLVFNVYPMNAAAFIMTPDIPLIFFWLAAMWATWRAVGTGKPGWWVAAGALMGLAMLSKYNGVLLVGALFGYLIVSDEHRSHLHTPWPYVAAAVAFALFVPVVAWNAGHEWVSFRYQLTHGVPSRPGSWENVSTYFFGQVAAMGLILGFASVYAAFRAYFSRRPGVEFAGVYALVPFLVFGVTSYKAVAEMNWPACAYPAFALAAGWWFATTAAPFVRKLLRWGTGFAVGLIMLVYLHGGFRILPLEYLNTQWVAQDQTNWFYGWREFARYVDRLDFDVPITTTNHQLAAELHYYLRRPRRIYFNWNQFGVWEREPMPPRSVCINYRTDNLTPPADRSTFDRLQFVGEYHARRGRSVIRSYYLNEISRDAYCSF